MSLINRVLRDLDAREASALERMALGRKVRPLPGRIVCRWSWPVFILSIVVAALLGGAVVWFSFRDPAPAVPPTSITSLPAAPPSSVAPPLVAQDDSALAPRLGTDLGRSSEAGTAAPTKPRPRSDTPTPVAPPRSAASSTSPEAKVSPPGTPLMAQAEPAPEHEKKSETQHKPSPSPSSSLAQATPRLDEEGSLPPRIEKQTRGGSAQEMAEGEYRRAMNLLRRGAHDEAQAVLEAALALAPGSIAARQALLALLVERRQFEQAAKVARDGLTLHPTQSAWAMLLARLQAEKGDLAAASSTLDQYAPAEEAANHGEYTAFRAHLHYRLGEYPTAIELYRRILAKQPGEGRWWYGLGLALAANKQNDEAREAFRQARDSGTLSPELSKIVEQRLNP